MNRAPQFTSFGTQVGARKRLAVWLFGTFGTKKDVILKNKAEKLLKTKDRPLKTNRNKPKNKAEKSFRIVPVEKTKLKTKLPMLLKTGDGKYLKPATKPCPLTGSKG